jgi:hypothetical protein
MFNEYDVVKLRKPYLEKNLDAGAIGTILIVYDAKPNAYEVEFCGADGESIAVLTLHEEELELK